MVLSSKEWLDKMDEIIAAIQNNGGDSQVIMDMLSNMWSSSVTYNVGDYVLYNNNIWKCLVQNSNIAPTEGPTWTKVIITDEISTLNSNLKKYAHFKDISVDTDSDGNAPIGNINGVIPLSCIPITIGVRISSILCNGYGIYYVKTDVFNTKITVRVLYTDYQ